MLNDVHADGGRLADRIVTPSWYHPTLGLLIALLVAAQALPGAYPIFIICPAIIAIALLPMYYSRKYGVLLTRTAGPRSKRILYSLVAVMASAMIAALLIKLNDVSAWWVAIPVVVAFVLTVVLGRRYDHALRQEIGARSGGLE